MSLVANTVNVGTVPGDGTGDPGRTAWQKYNSALTDLYGSVGTINKYAASVTAALATSQNNYTPSGVSTGVTNRLLLGAASGGSKITGLISAPDGWAVLVTNTSTTDSITLTHQDSNSLSANQFSLPNASSLQLPPLSCVILAYVASAWKLASLVGATNSITVLPSGDATGATDTTVIQAALTAATVPYGSMIPAGPTAAGNIVALKPGVYTTNAPLKIGSFTTLDARGSVINLASGTNNNMLQNLGATAVMTSTGSVGAAGNTMSFQTGASDPIYIALLAINPNPNSSNPPPKWGASVAIAQTSGYVSNGFTNVNATGIRNFQYVNSFTQAVFDSNWLNNASNLTLTLYYHDVNFHVLGGVWNMGTNGSGSNNFTDHCFRLFNCDGFSLEYCTFLGQGNNGLYAVSLCNATNGDIGPLYFDVNVADWTWTTNHAAGFPRDGVHINGPCRDMRLFALRGSTGDDLAVITTADYHGIIPLDITGDVSNVSFEDLRCGFSNQGLVKVIAGPGTTASNITVKKVTGNPACALYIGDDNRTNAGNHVTEGGTIDQLICEDVNVTGNTTLQPIVQIAGLGMKTIKLKNCKMVQAASSTLNMIEVGYQFNNSSTTPTTVADLTIDGLNPTLASSRDPLNVRSSATITQLRYRDWVAPLTNYPLIANAGTITRVFSTDILPILDLTGQSTSLGSTAAFTPGLSGIYEFVVELRTTTAGNAVTVTATLQTNNGGANLSQTTNTIAAQTLGSEVSQTFNAYCTAGQAINYSTTVSAAIGIGFYALSIRAKFIG